ncbi:hypothetical protein QQF64_025881 [Cirrhinus molitorella]|uniref:Interleukin-1 beta n=1 Tax=Cirrhinus molitorella TaxID=172907 RepID=A0ABR3NQ99_9TELE
MDHQLEPEVDLDPHQCCALSYVISQSTDKEVYLNLEDSNVTDVGMNMMLSCSPNIRSLTEKKQLNPFGNTETTNREETSRAEKIVRERESGMKSFLQCLPYISELR